MGWLEKIFLYLNGDSSQVITPAIVSTSVIVFAFGFGAFEVPFLLGQPYPSALPVLAYRAFTDVDLNARSEAMAISMVIAVITAVAVFVLPTMSNCTCVAAMPTSTVNTKPVG